MISLFIQADDSVTIENIENLNKNNSISQDQIQSIFNLKDVNPIFITDDGDQYPNFNTVGPNSNCDIVCINDENIDSFRDIKLDSIYLFVNDENKFFDNFNTLYKNVSSFIGFKFKKLRDYDIQKLKDQIQKISELVLQLEKENSNLVVQLLNMYKTNIKFDGWGERDLFLGLDDNIYYHPSFYYQKNDKGIVCNIKDFNNMSDVFHLSQPHLLCVMCETFYCNRDIYHNKLYTNEFKVPCSDSCELTTIFMKYSKDIFNKIMNSNVLNPENNLDNVDDFDSKIYYTNFIKNNCICNKIKGIDFSYRKIWSKYDNR